MLVNKAVQLAVLAAALLWESRTESATTSAVKLCGRKLSEIMSRVCHAYNSPSWDDPTVEQPAAVVRKRRQVGIADECCTYGCTWEQLNEYCAISANSESPLDALEAHMIADRSAEQESGGGVNPVAPAVIGSSDASGATGSRREGLIKSAARAAPVVGTVSPLLTWGRTLNTDLPPVERDRYAYVAVYT